MSPLATLSALLLAATMALSAPAASHELIVEHPNITAPAQGDMWVVATTQTVKWDTSNLFNQSAVGVLFLGFLDDGDDSGNENLDIQNPLASQFPLAAGSVSFQVPAVDTRDDYIVALVGDSGDVSDKFTIVNLSPL